VRGPPDCLPRLPTNPACAGKAGRGQGVPVAELPGAKVPDEDPGGGGAAGAAERQM